MVEKDLEGVERLIRPILERVYCEGGEHALVSIQSVVKSRTGESLTKLEANYILDFYATNTTVAEKAAMQGNWSKIIDWVLSNMEIRPKSVERKTGAKR